MKYLTIIINLIFFIQVTYGQPVDLISNGGFENGLPRPNQRGDFQSLNAWQDGESFRLFNNPTWLGSGSGNCEDLPANYDATYHNRGAHTADWFFDGHYELAQVSSNFPHHKLGQIVPYQGNGFAGINKGELIQQKLSEKIKFEESYKLSMYIMLVPENYIYSGWDPRLGDKDCAYSGERANGIAYGTISWDNPTLDIHLSTGDLEYQNENTLNWCGDNLHKGANDFYKANSIPLKDYSLGTWHYVEMYVKPKLPNIDTDFEGYKYDWLALELNHHVVNYSNNSSVCASPFLLIDEVKFEKVPCNECFNCTNKDNCLDVNVFVNSNGNSVEPRALTVSGLDNATALELYLYDTNNKEVLHLTVQDPPKKFYWDQQLANGTTLPVFNGYYSAVAVAYNDCVVSTDIKLVSFPEDYNTWVNNPPNPRKNICCNDGFTLSNQVIDNNREYAVGWMTLGPGLTLTSNAHVTIKAQSEILMNGINIESGAFFEAFIEPCTQDELSSSLISPPGRKDENTNESVLKSTGSNHAPSKNLVLPDYNIFPNPVINLLNIDLTDVPQGRLYIEILDNNGRKVYQSLSSGQKQVTINLESLSMGTYFLRLNANNQWLATKKILKQ